MENELSAEQVELLRRFRANADELHTAVAGLSEADLARSEGAGEWSIRQIVTATYGRCALSAPWRRRE